MSTKIVVAAAAVLLLAALGWRTMARRDEVAAQREAERRAAERRVDLTAIPEMAEPASKAVEEAPRPKFGRKPVIVELAFKEKGKKGLRPFVGEYRVVDATGHTVSNGDADQTGEPAVMILSPGEYEVRVPKKKFKQAFMLYGTEDEKKQITVVVAK